MAKSELQEDTTDEEASKALHDLSWIDLTEPESTTARRCATSDWRRFGRRSKATR
jgi:hypothetical protein